MRSWLFTIVRLNKWRLLILVALTLFAAAIGLAGPWPMQIMADYVFGEQVAPGFLSSRSQTLTLLYLTAGLSLSIFIVSELVAILSAYLSQKYLYRIEESVQKNLFEKILQTKMWETSRLAPGDYSYRLNVATGQVSNFVFNAPSFIAGSVFTIFSTLFILFKLSSSMALLTLIIVLPLGFTSRYFSKKIKKSQEELEELESAVYGFTNESIENTKLIQSFDRVSEQSSSFLEIIRERFKHRLRLGILSEYMGAASGGIVAVAMLSITILGGRQVFSGELTFGELLVFITYIQNFFGPVDRLISGFVSMRQSAVVIGRVHEVLAEDSQFPPRGNIEVNNFGRSLELRDVSLNYPNAPAISNIDLSITPGQKVGIFGPSGSGKSTLLAALTGQLPYSGSIKLDGVELSQIDANSMSKLFGVVSQRPMLFTSTIFENISYGLDEYNEDSIADAIHNSASGDFIQSMPENLNTVVGQSGVSVSGGEAQRLAIARTLAPKPKIIVLDEPTSALDPDSEREVIRTLFERLDDVTVIFVTHKPLFLRFMDQVLIVDQGTATNVDSLGGLDQYLKGIEFRH